jgi:hypothetical protein
VGCCWHHHHGPWCWGDRPEFEYEFRPRRREPLERESDALRELQEHQRELERELAGLREQIQAKNP